MPAASYSLTANFDGLVGPSHTYSGLAPGNLASSRHQSTVSNPKAAALQGLEKMNLLAELGMPQGFLPPPPRPQLTTLRTLGFEGSDAQVINKAARHAPELLAACYSASAMWCANAATVSPSADTQDGKVHITPANLVANFHRSLEPSFTAALLQRCFADPEHFVHHPPLPPQALFADEGAANHLRLSLLQQDEEQGIELFIYGHDGQDRHPSQRYPARQSRQASEAIIRSHRIKQALSWQQHPAAIDAGVFHNDVIAVANRSVLFCHSQAFTDQQLLYQQLHKQLHLNPPLADGDQSLHIIEADRRRISLEQAVKSYLYNSQLISLDKDSMLLLAPQECRENDAVHGYLQDVLAADNPIRKLAFIDLKQSMQNGGGPACLRLQVPLTAAQQAAVNPEFWLTGQRYRQLQQWINNHYRDRLAPADLADPQLHEEINRSLSKLAELLQLQSLYGSEN